MWGVSQNEFTLSTHWADLTSKSFNFNTKGGLPETIYLGEKRFAFYIRNKVAKIYKSEPHNILIKVLKITSFYLILYYINAHSVVLCIYISTFLLIYLSNYSRKTCHFLKKS